MRAFEVGVMNYEKFADDVVSYYTDGKLPSQGPLDYRYIPLVENYVIKNFIGSFRNVILFCLEENTVL